MEMKDVVKDFIRSGFNIDVKEGTFWICDHCIKEFQKQVLGTEEVKAAIEERARELATKFKAEM